MRKREEPNVQCSECGKWKRVGKQRLSQKLHFCNKECRDVYYLKMGINYKYVWCPHHPYANSRGEVAEHRLVMEKHIRRILTPEEEVHHKDGNKRNNNISNLVLYSTKRDHLRFGHPENKNNVTPVKKANPDLKVKLLCPVCNKEFLSYRCNVRSDTPCCSKECAAKQKSVGKWVDMNCPICGNSYQRLRSELKKESACSIECRHKLRSKGMVSLKCAKCGVQFSRLTRKVPDWDNGKPYYCSKSCSSQASAEKHRSA